MQRKMILNLFVLFHIFTSFAVALPNGNVAAPFAKRSRGASSVAATPNWSVNPADFEMSANLTATLYLNDEAVTGSSNLVGLFVDETCHGVAAPIYVMNKWLYFITIYSNTNNEQMDFKAYIADRDTVLNVVETILFQSNSACGSPTEPMALNTFLNYDFPPVVDGIPDQIIERGEWLKSVALDDYLTQMDEDTVTWTYGGNRYLQVSINAANVATITSPTPTWTGTDKVIFTAIEQTTNKLSAADTAVYTILPRDNPPEISKIPSQSIGLLGAFNTIDLNNYLTEQDEDSVIWDYAFNTEPGAASPPLWSVNPADYEMSMTITARVNVRGETALSGNHQLAAFAVDSETPDSLWECRGVATPTQVMGSYLYFLSIYANVDQEQIIFRFFDDDNDKILPVNEQHVFLSNKSYGTPTTPIILHAGYLIIDITETNQAQIHVVDSSWTGSELVQFKVSDFGTLNEYADSTTVSFTVLDEHQPVVHNIPAQTIEQGGAFAIFDLDDYVTELDGDPIAWSYQGNYHLKVSINGYHQVTVSLLHSNWLGCEVITFIARDNTPNALSSSDTVAFTIVALDHPPVVAEIPDKEIGIGSTFPSINLENYLTEVDGDSVAWQFRFSPPTTTDQKPAWNVNPMDYELSMNITALVTCRGVKAKTGDHFLGAFAAEQKKTDDQWECRGFAQPTNFMDSWLYFLNIYANANGDTIRFKFFDGETEKIFPVLQSYTFSSNAVYGSPGNPCQLTAALLFIDTDDNRLATIKIVNENWTGNEHVWFIATDQGTIHQYTDSTAVTFTVLPDHAPLLSGIPDQKIISDSSFQVFDLDHYLTESDGDSISWSLSGETKLLVDINMENEVSVSRIYPKWKGTESIIFTATDKTPNSLSNSDTVQFTIIAFDHRPEMITIPDQTIGIGGKFASIHLDEYLLEQDDDSVMWDYSFPVSAEPTLKPDWSVQPGDFESSMNVTAQVIAHGDTMTDGNFLLGAFSNERCRGVATPILVLGKWLYFLTIYANDEGENIAFKFYDCKLQEIFPVQQSYTFHANSGYGVPTNPCIFYAGFLDIQIVSSNIVTIDVLIDGWTGVEIVQFTGTDCGTIYEYADSQEVKFTVIGDDHHPVVQGIADQTIQQGEQFSSITLNEHLTEFDGDSIVWTASGNFDLEVKIDANSVTKIVTPNYKWHGSEEIIFIATDASVPKLAGADTARFTVQKVIPVELVSFRATVEENGIKLHWTTATESNNYGFHIQRTSAATADWQIIGFRPGNGTTTVPHDYSYVDAQVSHGKWRYRLKQQDLDGQVSYSQEIDVNFIAPTEFALKQNYPNPFNPQTNICYQLSAKSDVTITIYNSLGQQVRSIVNEQQDIGYYTIQWDGKNDFGEFVPSGFYIYTLVAGNEVFISKRMIMIK